MILFFSKSMLGPGHADHSIHEACCILCLFLHISVRFPLALLSDKDSCAHSLARFQALRQVET
jgi:hypothetical protein